MPAEEYVLARRVVVAVPGRHRDAFDAETHGGIEEIGNPIRILAVEQRAIDGDPKTLAARELDRGDGLVVHTLLAHGFVVPLAITVEVNREGQVRRRLVLVDVLREQDRIGAQIYEFLARDDARDDLRHLLVDQRLAAGNGDHRRAALVDRLERILDAHALLQDLLRIVDLAASRAGEIALEQGFQHEHQGEALYATKLPPGQVFGHPINLQERNCHALCYRAAGIRRDIKIASLSRQGEHRGAVVPPDPGPFQHKPGGVAAAVNRTRHLAL